MTHRGSIVAIDGETKLKDAIASMLEVRTAAIRCMKRILTISSVSYI